MKHSPYPKYKPSGVEWLGDVPEHWEAKRGRFAMRVNPPAPQLRALQSDDEVSFLPMEALGTNGVLDLSQTRILSEIGGSYTEFQDGDVIVAKITPCFENGKAALARSLVNGAAYGTTELHVLRAKEELEPRLLFYIVLSDTFRKLGESEMYGASGQKRVPAEFNKDYRLPLSPLPEQRAIAAFLDRETGRIDTLVAKKRELIERLKEKRTALISRTVTRGLPPDAAAKAGLPVNPPLKPSGLDWLGDIPEYWEVAPLMHLTDQNRPIMYGIVLPGPDVDDGVLIVKGGDVKPGRLRPEKLCRTTFEIESGYARSRLRGGDIVFSIRGTIGECELVPQELTGANLTQDAARVAPERGVATGWLNHVLKARSVVDPLLALSLGAAVRGINIRDLKRVKIPVPPLPEQRAIAAYLDAETTKLDALVSRVEEAIERLLEYRSALITAAVTGKIDVREAADSGDSARPPSPSRTKRSPRTVQAGS